MKKTLAFLSFLFSIQLLYAQTNNDSLLSAATLQQCIGYAVDHQPSVKQAQLQEEIVSYNIRSRLADWYPQIGGNYSLQHNFQRSTSFFNGTATPVGVKNTSTGQLYLDQTLFNRDVLLANRTQGDVRLQVRQSTVAEKIDITANVSKAYYEIITTQQQIKVATENIARLQKVLKMLGGMLAATTLAIFVVPVLFVLITKLSYGKKLKRMQEEVQKQHEVDMQIAEENL